MQRFMCVNCERSLRQFRTVLAGQAAHLSRPLLLSCRSCIADVRHLPRLQGLGGHSYGTGGGGVIDNEGGGLGAPLPILATHHFV